MLFEGSSSNTARTTASKPVMRKDGRARILHVRSYLARRPQVDDGSSTSVEVNDVNNAGDGDALLFDIV